MLISFLCVLVFYLPAEVNIIIVGINVIIVVIFIIIVGIIIITFSVIVFFSCCLFSLGYATILFINGI